MNSIDWQLSCLQEGISKEIWKQMSIELGTRLRTKGELRVKCGFDPTTTDLHLGHTIVLNKLKQFQDFGHQIIIILGDFTATIGDPTGRNKLRPPLSIEQTHENATVFKESVFKILDQHKTIVQFNGWWFGNMTARQMLELASHSTVSQMLARRDFGDRVAAEKPVFLHELMYPLLQAFDSVKVEPDVEIGGSDQLFNLMMGRDLMAARGRDPQIVLTTELLTGLDGKEKMSKSLGNHIAIDDPPFNLPDGTDGMFGKIMSIPDSLMWEWLPLLSSMAPQEKDNIWRNQGPKKLKLKLALDIVSKFHGHDEATIAQEQFEMLHPSGGKARQIPKDIETVELDRTEVGSTVAHVVKHIGLAPSVSEARRLIKNGGVRVGGGKIEDPFQPIEFDSALIQVGKRKFKKVVLK